MNTKVCSSWARYTTRTSLRDRGVREAARSLGEPGRRRFGPTVRRGLVALVTAATLTGGCGDGAPDASTSTLVPAQAPAALVAGSAGFKCHPRNRRAGICSNSGGTSGTGSVASGSTGGVAGSGGAAGSIGGAAATGGNSGAGGQAAGAPFAILAPAAGPVAVTTDGAAVVWVEPTAIRTCPATGCGGTIPAPLNATPFSGPVPNAVSIDENSVYWLSSTTVQRCARGGCTDNEAFATLPPNAIGTWRSLAVRNGVVYADARTAVYQCPVGGCDQTPTTVFGRPDDFGGTPFAVDDTGIFISVTGEAYGTYYCPFGGCPPTIGEPLSTPGGARLAAAGGTVYMWEQQGNITSCPSSGCPDGATMLAPAQTTLTSLAADASGVYWTTSDGTTGGVFKCALPACAGGPTALATGQANPVSLSVSEHLVVWANAGSPGSDGSIMGLAK